MYILQCFNKAHTASITMANGKRSYSKCDADVWYPYVHRKWPDVIAGAEVSSIFQLISLPTKRCPRVPGRHVNGRDTIYSRADWYLQQEPLLVQGPINLLFLSATAQGCGGGIPEEESLHNKAQKKTARVPVQLIYQRNMYNTIGKTPHSKSVSEKSRDMVLAVYRHYGIEHLVRSLVYLAIVKNKSLNGKVWHSETIFGVWSISRHLTVHCKKRHKAQTSYPRRSAVDPEVDQTQ